MSNSSKVEQRIPPKLYDQINEHESYRLKWSAAILETIKYHHPNISPIGVHSWIVKDRENLIIRGESIAFIVHSNGKMYENENNDIRELTQKEYHEKQTRALKQGQTPINEEAKSDHWLSWKVTLNHRCNTIQKTIICHLKSTPQNLSQQLPYNGYKAQWHHSDENIPRYSQDRNQTRFKSYLGKIINHHQETYEKSKSHNPNNARVGIEANLNVSINKERNATITNLSIRYIVQTIRKYWPSGDLIIKELARLVYQGIQKHRWKIICFTLQIIATKTIISPTTMIFLIIISLVYLWNIKHMNTMILKFTLNAFRTIAPRRTQKLEKSQDNKHKKEPVSEKDENNRSEPSNCAQNWPTQRNSIN